MNSGLRWCGVYAHMRVSNVSLTVLLNDYWVKKGPVWKGPQALYLYLLLLIQGFLC